MKKTRLLEIIREEIVGALNEAGLGDQITALDKQIEAGTRQMTPIQKKVADLQKKKADLQKKEADLSVKSQTQLEEDEEQLNEKPDFGGQLDKKVAAKYSEEDTLEAATEKITNRVLSDKGITKADVAKMDKTEIEALLKDIRAFISQKKQTPEVAAALEKQKEIEAGEPGGYTGKKLQDNQTNKAILRALGFGSKKGPKGPTKPKAEKAASTGTKGRPAGTKKATLTPGDDGFDKVTYSDDSDEEVEDTFDNETAPAGDTEMEKAARGTDELIKQYRNVMDTYKSMKDTDEKGAMDFLKSKQDIVKKYLKVKKGNF